MLNRLGMDDYDTVGMDAHKTIDYDLEEKKPVLAPKPDPKKPQQISGHDITFKVPQSMRSIEVQILEPNGRVKSEYTLTQWVDIDPGDKVRLRVK